LQSREQRKIEAIEKTFEKIEQRQKSGGKRGSEVETTNPVSVATASVTLKFTVYFIC